MPHENPGDIRTKINCGVLVLEEVSGGETDDRERHVV